MLTFTNANPKFATQTLTPTLNTKPKPNPNLGQVNPLPQRADTPGGTF